MFYNIMLSEFYLIQFQQKEVTSPWLLSPHTGTSTKVYGIKIEPLIKRQFLNFCINKKLANAVQNVAVWWYSNFDDVLRL